MAYFDRYINVKKCKLMIIVNNALSVPRYLVPYDRPASLQAAIQTTETNIANET